jgi:ABC-type Fe3+/spermidine/putrescine transport system ATPase subunit
VVQSGAPQTVHEQPATPFVARFLGYQDLLPGRVGADGIVDTSIGCFRPEEARPFSPGQAVELLIKPVMAAAGRGAAATDCNVINGNVAAVTFRGRFSQVWVTAGDFRLLFEEPGNPPFAPGDAIWIAIAPEQLWLYEFSPHSSTPLS